MTRSIDVSTLAAVSTLTLLSGVAPAPVGAQIGTFDESRWS
jgi:hypothetical protein